MAGKTATTRARRLRQDANLFPEQRAWSALRELRRHEFPVRRQHPIGPYVVAFAIVRARLVIEIDGGVHRLKANARRDDERDEHLAAERWHVLRIAAADAMHDDYLMRVVTEALGL